MALYWRHLKPDGALAVHVSNNFLDLAPVVQQLAGAAGKHSVLVRNHKDDGENLLAADWMLVTNNESVLRNQSVRAHAFPVNERPGLRLWTDSYNNLMQILKTPKLH